MVSFCLQAAGWAKGSYRVCLGCDFPPWLLQVKLMDLDNPVSRKLREVVERIRQERARFMKVGLLFHKSIASFGIVL